MTFPDIWIHPTAEVSPEATIGARTRIWHQAQVREGAVIGQNCILGKGVYVDFNVRIGDNVKIQNYALVYHGVRIEDGVFVGPQACLSNDRYPRAVTPDGRLKTDDDWEVGEIVVRAGASIGAGTILLPGIEIGRFAMIGAGAVVTRSVPDHGLALGAPARPSGWVCRCGRPLESEGDVWRCRACDWTLAPDA
jgi:UDP-2-acetamido-3-amino-2,3-dideoxy-glucuronate N-acetyltransferase